METIFKNSSNMVMTLCLSPGTRGLADIVGMTDVHSRTFVFACQFLLGAPISRCWPATPGELSDPNLAPFPKATRDQKMLQGARIFCCDLVVGAVILWRMGGFLFGTVREEDDGVPKKFR